MTKSMTRRGFLQSSLAGSAGAFAAWPLLTKNLAAAGTDAGLCLTVCNHWSYIGIGWQLGLESCVLSVTDAMEMADRPPHVKTCINLDARAYEFMAEKFPEVADRLIFDAHAPRDATRPGGLGKPFEWRLLKNLDPRVPFMLSGGLSPDNVAEAIATTRAGGVDVSSGVERAPGDKDPDLIRAFIRAARGAADGKRAANHR